MSSVQFILVPLQRLKFFFFLFFTSNSICVAAYAIKYSRIIITTFSSIQSQIPGSGEAVQLIGAQLLARVLEEYAWKEGDVETRCVCRDAKSRLVSVLSCVQQEVRKEEKRGVRNYKE